MLPVQGPKRVSEASVMSAGDLEEEMEEQQEQQWQEQQRRHQAEQLQEQQHGRTDLVDEVGRRFLSLSMPALPPHPLDASRHVLQLPACVCLQLHSHKLTRATQRLSLIKYAKERRNTDKHMH